MAEKDFERPNDFQYRPTNRKDKEFNSRAPKTIVNRTNYFDEETTRTKVKVQSTETFKSIKQRCEAYETRLYYEYLWTASISGQTFFYTFTYNDMSLPKYMGENCFDYEDLRYLLNGGLKKKLLRNYGTNFHYFVGAELGDGKGNRGLANNPHYHILFFLYPDETYHKYEVISVEDMTHLVRTYWQGFDQDTDGYHDYRTNGKGIVGESKEFGALVKDFHAMEYASKYATKDINLRKRENKIRAKVREQYKDLDKDPAVMEAFWSEVLEPKLAGDTDMTDREIFEEYAYLSSIWTSATTIPEMVVEMCVECPEVKEWYRLFVKDLVDNEIRLVINEYRNRYCNKCRISQGVGMYAMQFIADELNPTIPMPSKEGIKQRPISLYYYRKLYCNIVKDAENKNCYVLNERGIDYKCYHLDEQLKKLADKTEANYNILTPDLYYKITTSDINEEVHFSYETFTDMINNNNNKEQIFKDYATYKIIYEDRYFNCADFTMPMLDYAADYRRFLSPAIYKVDYDPDRCRRFVEAPDYGYLPYAAHTYFLPNIGVFRVFDLLADYLFVQGDIMAEKTAREIIAVKRFHSRRKLDKFYEEYDRNLGIFCD